MSSSTSSHDVRNPLSSEERTKTNVELTNESFSGRGEAKQKQKPKQKPKQKSGSGKPHPNNNTTNVPPIRGRRRSQTKTPLDSLFRETDTQTLNLVDLTDQRDRLFRGEPTTLSKLRSAETATLSITAYLTGMFRLLYTYSFFQAFLFGEKNTTYFFYIFFILLFFSLSLSLSLSHTHSSLSHSHSLSHTLSLSHSLVLRLCHLRLHCSQLHVCLCKILLPSRRYSIQRVVDYVNTVNQYYFCMVIR